jgi:acyl-homoserine-lactone acylase
MPDSVALMDTPAPAMRKRAALLLAATLLSTAAAPAPSERARWKAEAARVTITRDTWGIAHVRGTTSHGSKPII